MFQRNFEETCVFLHILRSQHACQKTAKKFENAIHGRMENSQKVLPICSSCVEKTKRYLILNCIVESRPKSIETDLKTINKNRDLQAGHRSHQTRMQRAKKPSPMKSSTGQPDAEEPCTWWNDNLCGIRIRGLPEATSNCQRERFDHDLQEVNKLFAFL